MAKKIFWDVRKISYEYPNEVKDIFFKKHLNLRKEYTEWVGKISATYAKDIDWWVSVPASRNPYFSSIYTLICVLETLKKLVKQNVTLVTDSLEYSRILKTNFKNNKKFNFIYIPKKKIKKYQVLKSIIFQSFIFLIIKLFIKKKKIDTNKKVLINNYPTYDKSKIERHFQFSKNFINQNKHKFFFTPTFLINGNIIKVLETINFLSKKNYIFKESILNYKDLLHSFLYIFRVEKFKKKFKKFKKYDLSDLIFTEIKDVQFYNASMIGILNFRFVKKLSEHKLNIKKVNCWLENHEQKGWNFGFRKYFPNVETFGYQGFPHFPQLMNTVPAKFEEKYKVIPKKIIIIGKAYVKSRREFFPKLKIKIGPSMIYKDVHINFKKKNDIKFLVILTEFKNINLNILKWVNSAIAANKNLKFYIKKPKILNMNYIYKTQKYKENINFVGGSPQDLFKKSKYVICGGPTSATIEALVYECQLLMLNIDPYDSKYLETLKISKNMYKMLNNKNEFLKFFKELKNYSAVKKSVKKTINLKKYLFEKVSEDNERIFL